MIRTIRARKGSQRNIVLSLTGFVKEGTEYIVKDVTIEGEKAIIITPYQDEIMNMAPIQGASK